MRATSILLSAVLLTACSQPAATPDEAFAQDFLKAAGVKSTPCPARYQQREVEEGPFFCAKGVPEEMRGGVMDAAATLNLDSRNGWQRLGTDQDNLAILLTPPDLTDGPYGVIVELDNSDPRLMLLLPYRTDGS